MNPRSALPRITVFETAAFDRSATPPSEAQRSHLAPMAGRPRVCGRRDSASGTDPESRVHSGGRGGGGGPLCRAAGAARSAVRGGEGGIRTLDGGIHPHNALAGRRLQPLGHFSSGRPWYRTTRPQNPPSEAWHAARPLSPWVSRFSPLVSGTCGARFCGTGKRALRFSAPVRARAHPPPCDART